MMAQKCFLVADDRGSVRRVLETGKWSLLAMYFLLEMCTIVSLAKIIYCTSYFVRLTLEPIHQPSTIAL